MHWVVACDSQGNGLYRLLHTDTGVYHCKFGGIGMKRDMICIICPRGCALQTEITQDAVTVSGNACPKGRDYAINECVNPVRTVTATVRVANRNNTMASVKTLNPVPKDQMMDVMEMLRNTKINAPVKIGNIILSDVCGSDIVITKNVE